MSDRVRLTVPSEPSALGPTGAMSEQFCRAAGASDEERAQISETTARLVEFVLERSYPDDPDKDIEVSYELLGNAVHVQVHDWGRPLASFGGTVGPPPAALAELAEGVEDLRLMNLGADGKRLTFTVSIAAPARSRPVAGDVASPEPESEPAATPPAPDVRNRIEVRDLRPGEEEAVSDLLYGNYALTYPHPDFYRPRWLAQQVSDGTVLSSVAVLDREIIGHHAILLPSPDAASAETGVAVVHTAYRGLGVFGRLFEHTLARAKASGLAAIYGRAVTVHPYSQRSERAHGYRESALMLGAVGAEMSMSGLSNAGTRTAHLLSVRVLRPARRPVGLPARYADSVRATYGHIGLDLGAQEPRPERDAISSSQDPDTRTAMIRIAGWGDGSGDALLHAIRQLDERHHDVIYADVDLHSVPDPDAAVAQLNELFFFYSGVVPFSAAGHDHLRLQRINSDNVETEAIVCDSDFAGRLRDWVADDRARVDR